MKVKFEYRISGLTENFDGEVSGEGKSYEDAMENAYQNLCGERHSQFLSVTFKKVD